MLRDQLCREISYGARSVMWRDQLCCEISYVAKSVI